MKSSHVDITQWSFARDTYDNQLTTRFPSQLLDIGQCCYFSCLLGQFRLLLTTFPGQSERTDPLSTVVACADGWY